LWLWRGERVPERGEVRRSGSDKWTVEFSNEGGILWHREFDVPGNFVGWASKETTQKSSSGKSARVFRCKKNVDKKKRALSRI